jgi:hypothetical protein
MHNPLSRKPRPEPSVAPTEAPKKSSFAPVRLAQALFSKQVKFKRDEAGYKLVLENSSTQSGNTTPVPIAVPTAAAQVAPPVTAASSLYELMDSAPGSRNAFRHLASIEQWLHTTDGEGLFLFDLSATHLKQALRQLNGLWMEPAPAALAELRCKMSDALAAQEQREKQETAPSQANLGVLSSFLVDEKMQVSEGRASDFHQLSESWGGPSLVPIER